ncbi:hypothetical protein R5E07_003910 [Vibrio vulnificus]|nr:hypothetical protein [Vibrio vulnificus]ELS9097782.1 hypothetical protein [Vibrio vulnificus]
MAKRTKATKETKAPKVERELPFTDKGVYITKSVRGMSSQFGMSVVFTANLLNIDEADVASYRWDNEQATTKEFTKVYSPKDEYYSAKVYVTLKDGSVYSSDVLYATGTSKPVLAIPEFLRGFKVGSTYKIYCETSDDVAKYYWYITKYVPYGGNTTELIGTTDNGSFDFEVLDEYSELNSISIKCETRNVLDEVISVTSGFGGPIVPYSAITTPEVYMIVDEYEDKPSQNSTAKFLIIGELDGVNIDSTIHYVELQMWHEDPITNNELAGIRISDSGLFSHDGKCYFYGFTNEAHYVRQYRDSMVYTPAKKGFVYVASSFFNYNRDAFSEPFDIKVIKRSDIDLSKPESETFIPLAKFAESWNTFILPAHERDMHKINKLIVDKAITSHTQLQSELMKVPELKKYGVNYKSTAYNLTLRDERNSRYWLLDDTVNKDNLLYPRANNQRNHKPVSYAVGDMFTQNTKLWIR